MHYDIGEVISHYEIYSKRENEYLIVLCPFHDDHNPSGRINTKTGRFNCFVCKTNTSLITYIAKRFNKEIRTVYFEIGKLSSTSTRKFADPQDIEEKHVTLFKHPKLMAELSKRCVDEFLIRKYRLGATVWGDGEVSISIPIWNVRQEAIAVKEYYPGNESKKFGWARTPYNNQKYKPGETRTLATALLHPVEQLVYDKIVLFGGEIKAIAATKILNKFEIGAISGTGSETTTFTDEQLQAFANKTVYVCYDIDTEGINSAEDRCRQLRSQTKDIYKLLLPLDINTFPHGDINDFIAIGGDLLNLISSASLWTYAGPAEDVDENEEPIETDLDTAVSASMTKKRIKINAVVSSMDTSPYTIPHKIKLTCTRDSNCCCTCEIYKGHTLKEVILELKRERLEIIEMVGREINKQEAILKKAFGIPLRCAMVYFTPLTFHHVEDTRISQPLDIGSRTHERSMQIAYCIGEGNLELNESYKMIGRMYPHPDNQQAALLISNYEATQDALSTYKPTNLDALRVFQPKEWTVEGIDSKLDDVYSDLEANVTFIYERRRMHLLYDLAYHSPLFIQFDSGVPLKGWVEVLVIGDSAHGKSKAAINLMEHYGLGERVICKGATVAGLMGGLQQYGKRWFVSWGKIPTLDRRIIILDELKGTSVDVIGKLTDMRSSGVAELTKIEKRKAHARTRLIGISNPRSSRTIAEYNYGVDAVVELVGNPEDVRRFDAILIVANKEVSPDVLNAEHEIVPHKYINSICKELILFGWTVPSIVFENKQTIMDSSKELLSTFHESIPIVDGGSMREKLARLSAALAVRTFSIKDERTVFVRDCHVQFIERFLKESYSTPAFGYDAYSKAKQKTENIINPEAIRQRILKNTHYPAELVATLLAADEIDIQTIQDTLGWAMQDARDLLAFFNRHNALARRGRVYYKTIGFTKLLKEININETNGRPKHVPEEF